MARNDVVKQNGNPDWDRVGQMTDDIATHSDQIGIVQGNVSTLQTQKANQTDLTTLQTQVTNMGGGSPDKVFATLAALQAAYPTGDSKTKIVTGSNGVQEVDTLTVTTAPTALGNITITLNGVAINIAVTSGVKEAASLTVTAIPTAIGNVTVTLNGVATTIALDPATDTTTDAVATKIRNATYPTGAVTGGTGSIVTFTAAVVGVKTDATYSAGSTGATGTMSTTTQGVDADTTTSVATKIRGTAFSGWTTSGSGTTVSFTKTSIAVNTTPTFSAGTTGTVATITVTTAGVYATTSDWYYWNGSIWARGDVYQSTGLESNSVGTINVKNGAITSQKLQGGNTNIYDPILDVAPNIIDNYYINSLGVLVSAPAWYISTPMPIRGGYTYIISNIPSGQLYVGAWYDINGTWVSALTNGSSGAISYVAPVNAVTLKLDMQKSNKITTVIDVVGFAAVHTENIENKAVTNEKIDNLAVTNSKLSDGNMNVFDVTKQVAPDIIDGKYLNNSGAQMTLSSWYISAPIQAFPGAPVVISGYEAGQAYFGGFYDVNGLWITSMGATSTTPTNAATFRVNINRTKPIPTVTAQTGQQAVGTSNIQNGAVTLTKLDSAILQFVSKKYFQKDLARVQLKAFFLKWLNKQNLNVLGIGDSITNFQNSEMLSVALQKLAPQGMAGENYLRKLWKILNYNVFNDDRTIANQNGNMGFKRFDHTDWVFSNGGYEGTSSALTTKDWGSNRSDASDSWRQRGFNGYTQVLISESSYNKPAVGTTKNGATAIVTVPPEAIGCSIVLMQGNSQSTSAQIKINNGTTDVVNENINPSAIVNVYELHRDYTLTPGTTKTVTITNLSGGELWLWGIEYWTGNFVRVINNGLAGNAITGLQTRTATSVTNYQNIDLIVWEVNALNDTNQVTVDSAYATAKTFIDSLIAFGVPVLMIFTHRNVGNSYWLQMDRNNIIYDTINFPSGSKLVGNRYFYPDYIKNYKALAAYANFAGIDMFSKSVDEIGTLANSPAAPANYFVDGSIHLGSAGVASYEEEFRKMFLWNDYE